MKIAILALSFFVLGFGVGIGSCIYLFAVDVDILAIPYINKGVIITKDVTIEQNGIQLHIPKNTQIMFIRQMPGVNEYGILFYVYWDDETFIELLPSKPQYFEFKKGETEK